MSYDIRLLNHYFTFLFCHQYVIISSGMMDADVEKVTRVLNEVPQIPAICLDVANGYSEHFVEFVKKVRELFPEHVLMVGK